MRYRKLKIDGRTVYAHRVIAARAAGRALHRREHVHHRNEDRLDNRLDNLEIKPAGEHARHHMLVHPITKGCIFCGDEFTPLPSHRPRDRTCGGDCKRALICIARLGDRARRLDVAGIRTAAATGESLRSIGRRHGMGHNSVKRIASWPDRVAVGVARYLSGLA